MSKYYAVRRGRVEGIYNSWAECEFNTKGYSGADYKSFKNYSDALDYLNGHLQIRPDMGECVEDEIIYCDGGKNRITGIYAYGSVVDGYGNDLLGEYSYLLQDMYLKEVNLPVGKRVIIEAFFTDVSEQQNNGAELLAMIAALRICLHTNKYKILYSDSQIVITWSKDGTKNKSFSKEKYNYINELVTLASQFSHNKIQKIEANKNLADLGFHK